MFMNTNLKLTEEQQLFLEVASTLWKQALAPAVKKYAAIKASSIEYKKEYVKTEELIYQQYIKEINFTISELEKGRLLGFFGFEKKGKMIKNNKETFIKFFEFVKQKKYLGNEMFAANVEKELVLYYYFYDKLPPESYFNILINGKDHIRKVFNKFLLTNPVKLH